MDLSTTFVLLLAASGVILLADRMYFKARRQRGERPGLSSASA